MKRFLICFAISVAALGRAYYPIALASELFPLSGPTAGGTRVTIGVQVPPGTVVRFGGKQAKRSSSSEGKAVYLTPPSQPGIVNVTIKAPRGDTRGIGTFTYFKFPIGALLVSPANSRYVTTEDGRPFLLVGAYTTATQVDNSRSGALDWTALLDFYERHGFNLIRGWTAESARDLHLPTQGTYSPQRYLFSKICCSGYGHSQLKWDLDQLNQAYFDRLRRRAISAGMHGIYISAMMFQGWDVSTHHCSVANSWISNPFNEANNINHVNGDPQGMGTGEATESYFGNESSDLRAVLGYQKSWVKRVVDTLGDLDNVIWEVANEAPAQPGADAWQEGLVRYIRSLDARTPWHPHLIWRTTEIAGCGRSLRGPDGNDASLLATSADIVSPTYNGGKSDYAGSSVGPKAASGSKIVILDDDHVNMHDPVRAWKAFTRGYNLLYANDALPGCNQACARVVQAITDVARLSRRLDLARFVPAPDLSSTRYALADYGREALIYDPSGGPFSADLSTFRGPVTAEWLGAGGGRGPVIERTRGGARHLFSPPLRRPSVLYLSVDSSSSPIR